VWAVEDFSAVRWALENLGGIDNFTSLTSVGLVDNPAPANIQPLLENTGLGVNARVSLSNRSVSCTDVAALEAKGVTVVSDCP
jgi:hypothetical protein